MEVDTIKQIEMEEKVRENTFVKWLGTLLDCFNSELFSREIYWLTTGQWKRKDIYEKEKQGKQKKKKKKREREKGYKGETNGKVNRGFPKSRLG